MGLVDRTEALRRADLALRCYCVEDEAAAPDGQVVGMVAALPEHLRERVLEFYPPRLPAIRGAALAFEIVEGVLRMSAPAQRGFWAAVRQSLPSLRDVCVLRSVGGEQDVPILLASRDAYVRFILDSFSPGGTLPSTNLHSQLLMAYEINFGPRAAVDARRQHRIREW